MEYNLVNILKELEINYDRFVKMCILFGCDYVKRINRIGPQFSFDLIKNKLTNTQDVCIESDISEIIETIKKKSNIVVPDNYREQFKDAYSIFTSDFEFEIKEQIDMKPSDIEKKMILKYLIDDMQIGNIKAKNRLANLYK